MSSSYTSVKSLHNSLPSFHPRIPVSALPSIAFLSLLGFFGLTFMFTTLSKSRLPFTEIATVFVASSLAGMGIVALFCTVGVYV
ncbi:hypothetical protein I307_02051 [Cryptococcus deuterogattii 99/473]|uniref:Dolichyl-diphosphooligosaccharide-protein glycosyltransferase subunit OST5 n=2 Tax=Cryptococcus deuterogattii TaxID=1859096 RepID=A0A0D0V6B7_9TREE|nr:hypothetical protein I309_04472 [Cryptococcus deuterogattii LA55]KIR35096.1 hypothetical protein I352_02363 [Cryptococcus deuterogattii MMRL2647]KIR40495.1 hypothetical protein I313_03821 [Cryptococcus deuterogattii Ram5]KIR72207.1 hypothetical protein I310_04261 [Cryptococcus deuterogattii CA1014]KIR93768.1 hypothetical protein I304_02444 [Cryptococcus deuterogattii CBS 10090]KIS00036.1 hypothetical protein L804_02673 [Cryptococcus deuterogattii 2001/935-1]KIY58736.1 hypothetical protein 